MPKYLEELNRIARASVSSPSILDEEVKDGVARVFLVGGTA
jgi:hypothetical protein